MFLQSNDKILFQGDSITHAFRRPEEVGTSYRLGAGWVMMLAAQLHAERPELQLQIENRGVCGDGILDLTKRWEVDCLAWRPTVLSILVGVNDTLQRCKGSTGTTVEEYRAAYRGLLQRTRRALPDLRLIMCEPFLLEVGDVRPAWREDLRGRQETVRELAEEFKAIFVPLQVAFDEAAKRNGPAHWLFDGIHPNAAGQWLIMQQWWRHVCVRGPAA